MFFMFHSVLNFQDCENNSKMLRSTLDHQSVIKLYYIYCYISFNSRRQEDALELYSTVTKKQTKKCLHELHL